MPTVAVIGGSNGGYATAADLADQGHQVQWYVRSPDNHRTVLDEQRVDLVVSERYEGHRTPGAERTVALAQVTTDLSETVTGADVVLVPLPTTTHESVRDDLFSHLEDGQVVVLCPGNCGSVLFAQALTNREDAVDVTVVEVSTLPYVTRKSGPGEVTISLDAVRLPVGAFPGRDTDRAYEALSELYDAAMPAVDALDAALNNSNACVNAVPTVLNAGAIEYDECAFNIHQQGVTESVYRAIQTVDEERIAVRETFGYGEPHFRQDEYYEPGQETGEHFYGADARNALTSADTFSEDPPSLDDRYIHEDVGIATVLLVSAGAYMGVPTPTADAVVTMAEALTGDNYRDTGRTLGRLGLDTGSRTKLKRTLERGFEA
jgi:opine dehydrogenase